VTTKGINKRVGWAQKFLDDLQKDKLLRSFEIFSWFFSAADRPTFEKKKKELGKLPGPKSLLDVKHLAGVAQVGIAPDKIATSQRIGQFIPQCQGLYDQMMKATEDRIRIMRVLSEAYAREADIYKELALAHTAINVQNVARERIGDGTGGRLLHDPLAVYESERAGVFGVSDGPGEAVPVLPPFQGQASGYQGGI
jgi:hypothetical protein